MRVLVPIVAGCAPVRLAPADGEPALRSVRAVLEEAPEVHFPGPVDSNSPAFWDPAWGLVVLNSEFEARASAGPSVEELGPAELVHWDDTVNGGRWMEAVIADGDGVAWGWYHNEPFHLCCTFDSSGEVAHSNLTAPRIGAAVSFDAGGSWIDLGVVMTAPADTLRCDSANQYFGGGHGDFSVVLDPDEEWAYFFFTDFAGDEQGVSVARMRWAERDAPALWKHADGAWGEPGLGGRSTPIFAATGGVADPGFDALWGPSVHWNTDLGAYVMLLSHAQGPSWTQEGIWLSAADPGALEAPWAWSEPVRIAEGGDWYPQVIGAGPDGTDKLAGGRSRLFVGGTSRWELVLSDGR